MPIRAIVTQPNQVRFGNMNQQQQERLRQDLLEQLTPKLNDAVKWTKDTLAKDYTNKARDKDIAAQTIINGVIALLGQQNRFSD